MYTVWNCTERWVRTTDLVSMNHTLLPTELSRHWRHRFSQHHVYDYDFNRTGLMPNFFTWRDFGHLNLYLSKESNLHTQIHGQDLQSWTSPIYVVNRHFKNHSNHIASWIIVNYNNPPPLTTSLSIISQIFNTLCNQDSIPPRHRIGYSGGRHVYRNILKNGFWAVDRIRTCEGIYALLIGSQAPSTTRRLPHICKREYRI